MPRLRSDNILALDELTEACQLAADHFKEFVQLTNDDELVVIFARLSQDHQHEVSQLDAQVKRMGELPRRPDPDREALEYLAIRLRTTAGENKRKKLLDKAKELEEGIRQKISTALSQELPGETRSLLLALQRQVAGFLAWIATTK